jgi:hypothetical protein
MLVQPSGFGGNNGFGGSWGGDGFWIILLFILLGGGMWGGMGGFDGAGLYPWMNNSQNINDGFRDQMLATNINGIQNAVTSGFGDVQTALCGGFAGVNATINGAQNAIAQQMYGNQIADMERSFNAQTATMQGFNGVQAQLANCCCENRAGIADLKYTVATENCADRTQSMMNTRDIIDSQTRGTQAIIDKLCALELDGYKRENDNLRQQLSMSQLAASQTAQNALIQQGFSNEVDALYNRLNSCPVPTTPVYGRTPIFTCGGQNVGCGCGVA